MELISDLPNLSSIKIGALFFKPKNGIEKRVARSIRPVTVEYPDLTEHLGLSGSCCLIAFRDKYFVACTRHQLSIKPEQNLVGASLDYVRFVSYVDSEALRNIPVDGVIFVTDNQNEEFRDVLLFKVAKGWPDFEKEKSSFFPIENFITGPRLASWIVGIPLSENQMVYDPNHYKALTLMLGCTFDGDFKSNAKHYSHYTFDDGQLDLNGFSGGAVFSLVQDSNEFEIVFDGIVTRAGSGNAYAVNSTFLRAMAGHRSPHSHSMVPGGLLVTS